MDKRYTTDQLLDDQDFVRWVKTGELGHTDWLGWQASDPYNEEQAMQAKAILQSIKIKNPVEVVDHDIDALWSRIDSSIMEQPKTKSRGGVVRKLIPVGIAAALLIATSIMFLFPSKTTVETAYGESMIVELPDGSKVHLNADSEICYSKKDWNEQRLVELHGEAFFEVEEGSRFTVETDHGQTTVLGTSFNVLDRREDFNVKCYTGRVEVKHSDEAVILTSGDKAHLLDYGLEKSNFRVEDKTWREGKFEFVNEKLVKVFEELERQFDVEIEASEDLGKLKYSGFFEINDLESALYAVCWPMRLKSVQKGKVVTITKENE